MTGPVFCVNDSPVMFGLLKVVNQVKLEGTLAAKKVLTVAPLQISTVFGILRMTSGTTETVNKLSGPTHP